MAIPQIKTKQLQPKSPLELIMMRRIAVREQKLLVTNQNLNFFPSLYIYVQGAILFVLCLVLIAFQIALIVKQSALYFICSGFIVSIVYAVCIYTLLLLGRFLVASGAITL